MSETRTLMECAVCHKVVAIGEVHTWLFCELHKLGHDRQTIIDNVLYTADVLNAALGLSDV